jgi:hypothetical protein
VSLVPQEEVDWGVGQEERVYLAWCERSWLGKQAKRAVKTEEFDPYDVLVFGENAIPLCALEIKVRRVEWGDYGDVMAPIKKHEHALALKERGIPFVLITQYACGTIVQVDLSRGPSKRKMVARRDRPGMKPVEHGLWSGSAVRVYEPVNREPEA